ncbi:MAG: hypothetical protein WD825_05270 [Gemmatimonadaceae bacterium]
MARSARRILGSSLLLFGAAACVPQTGIEAPKPLKPEDGPRGSIHTSYSGGIFLRSVNAVFRVQESAHVIVAHLSGDGVIRVVYPESPRQPTFVPAKKALQTGYFDGDYDAAPSLLTFTANPFRGLGASMDSYDGRGHGFVFMIATRTPMFLGQVADRNAWLDVEIEDYYWNHDPRFAIRDFAEMIADGEPFTLKFAHSFSSQSFTTYAASAWDCAMLSSYGLGHSYGFWGTWGAPGLWFLGRSRDPYSSFSRFSSCGMRHGLRSYAWNDLGRTQNIGPRRPNPVGTVPPSRPPTPTLARPGYRPITDPSPAVLVTRRVVIDRKDPATRTSGRRARDADNRRRVVVEEIGPRATRSPERTRSNDDARSSRPRETTHSERPRASETSRPAEVSRPAPDRARPAEQPRSQPARASSPSETRTSRPAPKPDKPPGE